MVWLAAVDYRRGSADPRGSKWCRNYGKLEKLTNGIVLGAVADGAGPASRSHVGAKVAVRAALNALRADEAEAARVLSSAAEAGAAGLFERMMREVEGAMRRAAFEEVVPVSELASSLTVFLAGPLGLAAMQVGAGVLVYRLRGGEYAALFSREPDVQPGFVAEPGAGSAMRVQLQRGPIEFLCLASEALQPASIRLPDGAPREPFFQPLDRYAAVAIDDGEIHRGIREFLRSDRLGQAVEEDLTLALCRYVAREPSAAMAR